MKKLSALVLFLSLIGIADAQMIAIAPSATQPSITLPPISFSGGPGNVGDYMVIVPEGTAGPLPDSAFKVDPDNWRFMNDTRRAPSAGLTAGKLTLPRALTPGNYEVRWYRNRSRSDLIANLPFTINPPVAVGPAPSFVSDLTNSGDLTVAPGDAVTGTITATLITGSPRSIAFAVKGTPPSSTATFSQAQCIPTCSVSLTITTSNATPVATYPISVSALGGSTQFNVTVQAQTQVCGSIFCVGDSVSPVAGSGGVNVCTTPGGATCVVQAEAGIGTVLARGPAINDGSGRYYWNISWSSVTVVTGYTSDGTAVLCKRPCPPGATFNFNVSTAGNISVSQAGSTVNTVSTTLTSGTTQAVNFSVSGLPANVTGSFSPSPCSPGCSSTLAITAGLGATIGTYPVTVTATSGALLRTALFSLVVIQPPPPPTGNNYYVSSGVGVGAQAAGDDSNPGTIDLPFKTLQKAIPLLTPGKTLIVRGGEYDTVNGLANGDNSIIPSGTSWTNAVTIKAYPSESPVFRRFLPAGFAYNEAQLQGGDLSVTAHNPTLAECKNRAGFNGNYPWGCWGNDDSPGYLKLQGVWTSGFVLKMWNGTNNPVQYIIFDGINFDAEGIVEGLITLYDGAQHLKFQNLEIRNGIFSCVSNPGGSESLAVDHQWINVKIHHCGAPYDTNTVNGILAREHPASRFYQTWYMHSSGVLWDGIESYKNSGAGVSPLGRAGDYLAGGNTIRNSYFHDNTEMSLICAGGWLFEKNVVVSSVEGITTYGCTIRHNTFVSSNVGTNPGVYLYNFAGGSDLIENNIFSGFKNAISSDQLSGPSPVARNNLFFTIGTDIVETGVHLTRQGNLSGDPKFVNPGAGNYNLQVGSPAIGTASDATNIGAKQ